jgi:hypothetical protein
VASGAWSIDAGKKQEFDHDETLAFAVLAAALGDIERKTTGIITSGFGERRMLRGAQRRPQLHHFGRPRGAAADGGDERMIHVIER